MFNDRIVATYRIETARPLEQPAAVMAGEQSTGTFVRVAVETDALRERFAARVEHISDLDTVAEPTLPGLRPPRGQAPLRYRRAEVVLSWPLENVGPSPV